MEGCLVTNTAVYLLSIMPKELLVSSLAHLYSLLNYQLEPFFYKCGICVQCIYTRVSSNKFEILRSDLTNIYLYSLIIVEVIFIITMNLFAILQMLLICYIID